MFAFTIGLNLTNKILGTSHIAYRICNLQTNQDYNSDKKSNLNNLGNIFKWMEMDPFKETR